MPSFVQLVIVYCDPVAVDANCHAPFHPSTVGAVLM